MSFGYSGKKEDVSLKLRAQNMSAARKQTSQLEVDNRQMEQRLQELKIALNSEKEERERNSGNGFWRTGQQGNLGGYATEVLNKPSKEKKKKTVKVLKDEPIVTPERRSGPGSVKHIADRGRGSGKENMRFNSKDADRCGQCEKKNAHVSCLECGEDYCASCFAAFHMKGALKKHRSVPLGSAGSRTPRGRVTPTEVDIIMNSGRSSAHSRSTRSSAKGPAAKQCDTVAPRPPSVPKHSPKPTANNTETLLSGDYDEREAAADFQRALADWRSGNMGNATTESADTPTVNPPPAADMGGGSLLSGDYDEREGAADFQRALAEWRQPATRFQPHARATDVHTPVYQLDSGTGMDVGLDQQALDLSVHFHSTLSYAEKLMLKRHRRHQLGPVPDSSLGLDMDEPLLYLTEEQQEQRPNLFGSTDLEILNQEALDGEVRGSRVDIASLLGGSATRPMPPHAGPDRSDSSLSIIEISNATRTGRSVQSVETSSKYEVTEVESGQVLPTPSSLARVKSNALWGQHDVFSDSVFPRTEPHIEMVEDAPNSMWQVPSSKDKAASIGVKKARTESVASPQQHLASEQYQESSQEEPSVASARAMPSARGKARPQSRAKSRAQSRTQSRTQSRLSLFGEGVLTKEPSPALSEIASLARQVTTDVMFNTEYKLGLADFFTAGVESSPPHSPEERSLTPSLDRRRPVSGRSRPASAARSRPPSAAASKAADMPEKWKISNKLYSMTPRSWKPDFSLADTVPDSQAQLHVQDQRVIDMDRMAEESLMEMVQPRAGGDTTALADMTAATPHNSNNSSNNNSLDTREQNTPSPRIHPLRESSMIVMEGEDLSVYDHHQEADTTGDDDNTCLNQLEWELASHTGRLTADGRLSRLIDDDSFGDNLDEQEKVKNDRSSPFDFQHHLRASELMDDFEEMEAAMMEEEEVKQLI